MSENILRASGIHKVYKNGSGTLSVLKGIDLHVKEGEFLGIQGPSGAGKSTLLHILGGLDSPSQGNVFFENSDIYGLAEDELASLRNRTIGFVFQFYYLLPELNVLENTIIPMVLKSWWHRKKALQLGEAILEKVGLGERKSHMPNQLSGGEQQRVALARALINEPRILFCDEPTGNLDSENGQNIMRLIKSLNNDKKTTIILVTHDKEIASLTERVVCLKDGLICG